ncbi:chaperone NapD [Motilimonas sp. KMU-193]|uniref:chaperone NapD n=1 Tax=Motilimonas sp. KMU-193 TaxID=3388668 RepID=UPI00396B351F
MKECHISSLVVYCAPEREACVAQAIAQLAEAEIYAQEGGKLVVVIESTGKSHILATVETLNNIEGVINTALVYHQFEELADTIDVSTEAHCVQCEDNQ